MYFPSKLRKYESKLLQLVCCTITSTSSDQFEDTNGFRTVNRIQGRMMFNFWSTAKQKHDIEHLKSC